MSCFILFQRGWEDILSKMGYEKEGRTYILYENRDRRRVENEIQDFYADLLNFQRRNTDSLRSFLRDTRSSQRRDSRDSDRRDYPSTLRSEHSSFDRRSSFRSSIQRQSFAPRQNVQIENERTTGTVQRLKVQRIRSKLFHVVFHIVLLCFSATLDFSVWTTIFGIHSS